MTLMLCGILIKTDYKQLNRFVMKTKLLIIAGLIGVCCLISCKKEGMDNHGNSNVDGDKTEDTLPELEEVDDVCTKMDDINFMKYCYDNFDVNKDGKVSMPEANAVKSISYADLINSGSLSLCNVVSFTGIEYFSNLENISLGGNNISVNPKVKTINLCYNKHLTSISMLGASNISSLDLRYNKNLQHCSIRYASNLSSLDLRTNIELEYIKMEGCSKLKSIYLPKSIESIPASAFNGCDCLTIVDMSQCVDLKEILMEEHTFNPIYTFSSEVIDEFLIGATVPPKTSITSNRPIKGKSIKTLKVPAESVEAYENSVWEDYAVKIIPLEN